MRIPPVLLIRSSLALLALAVAPGGCRQNAPAPVPALTLESLAVSWSGATTPARCEAPTADGLAECEWSTLSRGDSLTGLRDVHGGVVLLKWLRAPAGAAVAAQRVDSLGSALERHGLTAYRCPTGGFRWQRPGLGVEFHPGDSTTAASGVVSVLAVAEPGVLPTFSCPSAPRIPVAAPGVRAKSA